MKRIEALQRCNLARDNLTRLKKSVTLFKPGSADDPGFLTNFLDRYIVDSFRQMVAMTKEPQIDIGPHCDKPYECDFKYHCWSDVPDYTVLNLFPGDTGWKIKEENNSFRIEDLTLEQSSKRRIDYECYLKNSTYIDYESLSDFLDCLKN